MKKIGLVLVMVMVAMPMVAQDTLLMFNPKWNYYVNSWPDSSQPYNVGPIGTTSRNDMWAINFYTEDTLTIYGIATVLFQVSGYELLGVQDKDPTHAIEDMLLFEHDSTLHLRQVAEPLPVCIATDSPAYYWQMEHGSGYYFYSRGDITIVPVYERYFTSPYRIVDTFYVGMTTRCWERNDPYTYSASTIPLDNWAIPTDMTPAPYMFYRRYRSDGHWQANYTAHLFIMPIIAIDSNYWPGWGDTTERAGEDTTGHVEAVEVAAANRFVAVNPNPATGEVKVTSTVGMRKVEVYSAEGVKVVEKETAEGEVQTRLDVSRLHGGSYVVRVYTSVGMAIKKLVVQ